MTDGRTIVVLGLDRPDDPVGAARIQAVVDTLGPERVVVAAAPEIHAQLTVCRTIAPIAGDLVPEVRAAGGIVVAGGTLGGRSRRHDRTPWTSAPGGLTAMARLASAGQVPFALVGVGVGPLRTKRARRKARHLVKRADLLILRDDRAAAALAAAGAHAPFRVGADPAWATVRPRTRFDSGSSVLVVVGPGSDGLPATASSIGPVAATGCAIHLQPTSAAACTAARDLAGSVLDRAEGQVQVRDPVASFDALVERMAGHRLVVTPDVSSLIAAAAAGAAVVVVGHEPGVVPLARRLAQRSVPGHATPAVLARAMMLGLEQSPVPADRVADEVERAVEGLELASLLFDQSGTRGLRDFNRLELTSGPTP